ncbi:hypothetical protein F4809DRAFT_596097, partial [Biscogniauxia mediterranea]
MRMKMKTRMGMTRKRRRRNIRRWEIRQVCCCWWCSRCYWELIAGKGAAGRRRRYSRPLRMVMPIANPWCLIIIVCNFPSPCCLLLSWFVVYSKGCYCCCCYRRVFKRPRDLRQTVSLTQLGCIKYVSIVYIGIDRQPPSSGIVMENGILEWMRGVEDERDQERGVRSSNRVSRLKEVGYSSGSICIVLV